MYSVMYLGVCVHIMQMGGVQEVINAFIPTPLHDKCVHLQQINSREEQRPSTVSLPHIHPMVTPTQVFPSRLNSRGDFPLCVCVQSLIKPSRAIWRFCQAHYTV